MRFFGIGGAPLAAEVEEFLKKAHFPYAIGYGLTETAPLIAGCAPKATFLRSTGPVLKGVELRIADPKTITGEGEIQARSDQDRAAAARMLICVVYIRKQTLFPQKTPLQNCLL